MKTENMKSNQVKQIICQTGDFYDKIIKKEKKCVYCLKIVVLSFSFEGRV